MLELHPDDAAARGIADGSTVVRVFNDRGSYECHAEVVHPRPPRRGGRAWASGGASWG